MKKNARKWSILLILTLIFSFEGMAVFAVGEDADLDQAPAAEQVVVDDQNDADFEVYKTEAKSAEVGYVITWKNYDGTLLGTDTVEEGAVPVYSGATPVRPNDATYKYTFSGWSPAPAAATGDAEYTAQFTQEPLVAPASVTGLVAYPGADQTSNPDAGTVTLYWNADPNASKYDVYANGSYKATVTNNNLRKMPASDGGELKVSYTVTGLNEYKKHSFAVYSYDKSGKLSGSAPVTKQPVRPINYVMKMKKKVSLKSHAGKSQSITLAKNEVVKAYGFNSGKYVFKRGGSIFYLAKSRGKGISADFTKSFNYTRGEAENYVNTAYIGSASGSTLIWVSTYCQHAYYFIGSKGNWTCIRDWECATGKAISPSPTGMWGNKEIGKKIKKRHGLKFWSTYSSMNAFHGKQPKWKVGTPASGGCIRNSNENAEFIYKHAPKRTKVIVG